MAGYESRIGNQQAAFIVINKKVLSIPQLLNKIAQDKTGKYLSGLTKGVETVGEGNDKIIMGTRAIQAKRQIGVKPKDGQSSLDAASEASEDARLYIEKLHFETKLNLNSLNL